MSHTAASERLWIAVDSITKPTRRSADRRDDATWLEELATDGQGSFCRIADYRAAVSSYGSVPALWDQAQWSLTGSEAGDGSGGRSPLRERTPADLDLMETMLTIRESMAWQLKGRGITPKAKMTDQMRQLAAHIVSREPQHVEWWTYRFEQWSRVLGRHLNAVDAPKPVRLRNAPCPVCKTKTVTIEDDNGEQLVVPPLLIDFVSGAIRAATCTACLSTWWRGDDLGALADLLDEVQDTPPEVMLA